ncbi:MAG: hypothetical protein FWC89_09185 [Defluviitaleaceae bacterium]|nr:hypothetical protein [Defluviitaleaceae bacterium]
MQAYEGYVEGGQFYPTGIPIRVAGRFKAILTVLDAPAPKENNRDCPLLGLYADGKLTVEMHHAWSREDKAREGL